MEEPSSPSIKKVFFASDPQVDSLLPSTFVNGFQERLGSRANALDLYALLDWIVRSLLTTQVKFPYNCGFCSDEFLFASFSSHDRRATQKRYAYQTSHPTFLLMQFSTPGGCI